MTFDGKDGNGYQPLPLKDGRKGSPPRQLYIADAHLESWPALSSFMNHMLARLEEKETDPKKMGKSWRSTPMIELEKELRNQVLQLGYAFRRNDKELIRKKAVDAANYLMMIYDNLGR